MVYPPGHTCGGPRGRGCRGVVRDRPTHSRRLAAAHPLSPGRRSFCPSQGGGGFRGSVSLASGCPCYSGYYRVGRKLDYTCPCIIPPAVKPFGPGRQGNGTPQKVTAPAVTADVVTSCFPDKINGLLALWYPPRNLSATRPADLVLLVGPIRQRLQFRVGKLGQVHGPDRLI